MQLDSRNSRPGGQDALRVVRLVELLSTVLDNVTRSDWKEGAGAGASVSVATETDSFRRFNNSKYPLMLVILSNRIWNWTKHTRKFSALYMPLR